MEVEEIKQQKEILENQLEQAVRSFIETTGVFPNKIEYVEESYTELGGPMGKQRFRSVGFKVTIPL